MAKTAMAAAFERVGIDKAGMTLHAQVVTYAKTGGTEERAIEIVRQVFASLAGQRLNAAAQQSNEDAAGHMRGADSQPSSARPSSPDRGSGGPETVAKHGRRSVAPTVREPTAGQRKAAAIAANVVSLTVLDTYRLLDGRLLKDVRVGELEGIRTASTQQAALIRQIQRIGVADHSALVGDIIKPEQLQRMLQRAAEVADAG
jgi:hypothetical protein